MHPFSVNISYSCISFQRYLWCLTSQGSKKIFSAQGAILYPVHSIYSAFLAKKKKYGRTPQKYFKHEFCFVLLDSISVASFSIPSFYF